MFDVGYLIEQRAPACLSSFVGSRRACPLCKQAGAPVFLYNHSSQWTEYNDLLVTIYGLLLTVHYLLTPYRLTLFADWVIS